MFSRTDIDLSNDKGVFLSLEALQNKHPSGKTGWYAYVLEIHYIWDDKLQKWVSLSANSNTLAGELPEYYLDEAHHIRQIIAYSNDGVITSEHRIIKVDTTSGDVNITLPTAVGFIGRFDIMKIDGSVNSIFVLPVSAQTISGETSQEIFGQFDNMTIISDNSNWLII